MRRLHADILVFSFVASIGTGVLTQGAFFLASEAYGYGSAANFALGVLIGALYIPATLLAGRIPDQHARTAILASLLLMTLASFIPPVFGGTTILFPGWDIVLTLAIYTPCTGILWPFIESYLVRGRTLEGMRAAVGRFNVTWGAAVVVAFFAMGPILDAAPLMILVALGVAHLVGIGHVASRFPSRPGPEIPHEEHLRASDRAQRAVFRFLLPTSYFIASSLGPFLPTAVEDLRIPVVAQPFVAAIWLVARVAAFVHMDRTSAWQGSARTPRIAGGLMIVGFGIAVLSPLASDATSLTFGRLLMGVGLAAFGFGAGMAYHGALYYAMAADVGEVHAGGKHEGFIGVGYMSGPLAGLLMLAFASVLGIPFELALVAFVWGVSTGVAILADRKAKRTSREGARLAQSPQVDATPTDSHG